MSVLELLVEIKEYLPKELKEDYAKLFIYLTMHKLDEAELSLDSDILI